MDLADCEHPAAFGTLPGRRQQRLRLFDAQVLVASSATAMQIEGGITLATPS
ncbi:MAG: hypothetical protein HIU89_16390 [Proteobacteria bacterium]|nr:hypothetical protein [Pseudomonadota bacterium]